VTRAEQIAAGLNAVRARIAAAAEAAGRAPGSVRLVAVSKKMPAADIQAALAAGQTDFGENYGQELRDKRAELVLSTHGAQPIWHFIGPLQTNKVKYVAGQVAVIHSIDSTALLDELERRGQGDICLVQVNLADEQQKRGVSVNALPALLDHFARLNHVRCEGLMLIPPLEASAADNRPRFAALRALRDYHAEIARPNVTLRELSMGMSHDFEVAIAEGATMVRVGTAIFGERRAASAKP
jgi:pyridoxal phosphate enzyme (YggS family)